MFASNTHTYTYTRTILREIPNLFPSYYYYYCSYYYYYYFYLISSRLCCVDSCQQPICNEKKEEKKNGLGDRKSDHFAFIYGCVQLFLLTVLPQFSAWFGIKLRYVWWWFDKYRFIHTCMHVTNLCITFDRNDSDKQT